MCLIYVRKDKHFNYYPSARQPHADLESWLQFIMGMSQSYTDGVIHLGY